ncbi:hypothetical protein [Pedobacter agri]|uniref:hypothetical protein n=1 Tax=Pedobacter agri TaxID=454586 RepID=UPI00292E014F|nr:hypothetical protein [Pedobacter agri]
MLFHREAASKGLPRFLLFSSLALLVLGFLLTYHIIIFGGSILLEPKGEITFRRTVFTTSDVKDLIEKYSKLSSIEISQLENDRFAMLLNLRGIIVYSPGVLPEEEFSDEFLKTHEDAVTRLKINLADNNFFFPSGLYKAKNYHDIKGYYLKDVLIRYTSEYSSKYRITLLFKKLDARNYYEFITYDRDDVDSTLTIPVQSKTLGNFTVNGKFKFQTNPETLSSNQTALEISYSHVSSSVPTQFTFFKPDIN